ncbi:hypothetical protein D3C80_2013580 [compost metagenome]
MATTFFNVPVLMRARAAAGLFNRRLRMVPSSATMGRLDWNSGAHGLCCMACRTPAICAGAMRPVRDKPEPLSTSMPWVSI